MNFPKTRSNQLLFAFGFLLCLVPQITFAPITVLTFATIAFRFSVFSIPGDIGIWLVLFSLLNVRTQKEKVDNGKEAT